MLNIITTKTTYFHLIVIIYFHEAIPVPEHKQEVGCKACRHCCSKDQDLP